MTTATVTPWRDSAAMRIEISHTADVTAITRADVNGTRPIRTIGGIFPQTGTGSFGITDHEAALVGIVEYRISTAAGTVVQRATFGTEATMPPRFTIPLLPQYSVAVAAVTGYDEEQQSTSTIHDVIDSSAPLVVLGRMRLRRGTFQIVVEDYEEIAALKNLMHQGSVINFRQSENTGQDSYFVATSYRAVADPDLGTWEVSVGYVEVHNPEGNMKNLATWTFAALAASETSFSSVAQDYGTFADVKAGQK